ncbi:MAG: T9SS type A sorting domain-containing protein, partial [Paludibacter sp.]
MKNLIYKILVAMIMLIVSNQVIAGNFNQTICAGTSTTIGIVYPGATLYQWNTIPTQYTPTITVNPIVNTSYIVNVFAGTTWMLADTFNITVNAVPIGTITPNQSICAGTSATLTATGGVSYLWSPGGATTPSITVSPGTTTIYSVLITGANGCTITLSSTVTVNPLPTFTSVGSNSPVCTGNTLNLNASANAGSTYAWTGPNGFTSNQQNPTITNSTVANAGTYNVTATLNGCSATTNTVVVINVSPTFTSVGSNSPVCTGNTLNLNASANAGSTYAWTGPNGFTSNQQNPTIANVTTANAGTYNVTATLNGCSTSTNTGVIINIMPTVTASGSGNICTGETIYLFANGTAGCTYAWTGPNGFTSNQQNPTIANSTVANAGTYNVTAMLNSCSTSANTNVTVNTSPNASISGNTSICTGGSTILTATGGVSYLWSNGATTPSITVSPGTTTVYSVVVTGSNGCHVTLFANVVVYQQPVVNISPANPRVCEGVNVTLTASGANSYLWSNGMVGAEIIVNPSIPTNYTVTGTNAPGCSSTANVTVLVDPKPIVNLYLPQQNICLDANPITINGGSPAGGTYYGSGIFAGLFYPSTVGVGTYNIYYEYTNAYGCKATASQLLAVNPLPTVLFNSIFPNPVDLNATAFQLNTGIPLGGMYSGPGVVNGWFYPAIAGKGIHTIVYTYTDFMSCTNTAMQTLTVVNGLGVEEQNSSKIRIYPNPVTDYLNIEMEEKADYVQTFNLTGSVLSITKVDSEKFRVNVIHLTKGIYFMKFIY